MFELKPQHELVQLLSAGASFSFKAGIKPQHERVQLATAAKNGGGYLTLSGLSLLPQHELVQLATAGKGHVTFQE